MSESVVRRRVDAIQPELVRDLQTLIRQPSVSATGTGISECAELVKDVMHSAGIRTEILHLGGAPPLVYGEVRSRVNPDRTLLFYHHYDVQPPEPLEEWLDPPFSGTVREGKIFGRGAADDKGELLTRIKAVQAHLQAYGDVPCNVKFVVEGEEETGSANISKYLRRHRRKLACDAVVWEFGFVDGSGRPVVGLGMKGLLYVELTVEGPASDAHSSLAPIMRNPAWQLVHALGTMRSTDGRILIRGWYDEVRPLSRLDLKLLKMEPFSVSSFRKEFGAENLIAGMVGIRAKIALAAEPTCNIAGFQSGYTGSGAKTVLPARASAKIDFRLVPNMDPRRQIALLRQHLDASGFGNVRVNLLSSEAAFRTDPSHWFVGQVESATRESFGDAILSISNPGTGPMHQFATILDAPCVSVGSTYVFSRIHSPNEFARLDLLKKATRCICGIMEKFGRTNQELPSKPE